MEIIDFLVENYTWFILGGIVILMVLIGYFAEKTQFGKKTPEKTKKSKQSQNASKVNSKKEEAKVETQPEVPVETVLDSTEEIPPEETIETPSEEMAEEPMEDLDSIEIREPEEKGEKMSATENLLKEMETSEVPEDLYVGLDGTPNVYKPESEPSSEDLDLDLPNIDALKDDMDDTSLEEDDIWRF